MVKAKVNEKKYENTILYLAHKLGGEIKGKKKLAKLLYFADFDLFEKEHRSITSDTYKALPMGPFPVGMETVLESMGKNGKLKIAAVEERPGYRPTEVYTALSDTDLSRLDAGERAMLDRIIQNYGGLTGKQLEDLSHAEAPYLGTQPNDEIIYELAYYRGTDFG